ncbi:cysteine synthase B, partial [mine drainage metagenome]
EAYDFGIGKTPIFSFSHENGSNVYAKLEYFNRFGSIKDRAAFFMIKKAIQGSGGSLNKVIVEGSSGNTGIAIGYIATELGVTAEIIVPPGISPGTLEELKKTGANIIMSTGETNSVSTEGAINQAKKKARDNPGLFINLYQHGNESNTMSHVYTTGPEIEEALGKVPDYVAIGMGTGGSITGIGKYFKERSRKTKVYLIHPDDSSFIQGLRNFVSAKDKKIVLDNIDLIDGFLTITAEKAFSAVKHLADNYGIYAGHSSGANYYGAMELARSSGPADIVTVFPDSGVKYHDLYKARKLLSEEFMTELERKIRNVPSGSILLRN